MSSERLLGVILDAERQMAEREATREKRVCFCPVIYVPQRKMTKITTTANTITVVTTCTLTTTTVIDNTTPSTSTPPSPPLPR
jgi:hypothetical protein